MIHVENLSKSFGTGRNAKRAVDDVSFVAHDGEITGLLGPNGCGKTTTLRMVSGLFRPDGGRALVDDIVVAERPGASRERLGILPDARGLYERLTARENILYFAHLQGVEPADASQRIEHLEHELSMGGIIDRRVKGFSQGERVKVAIARALIHHPHNVLLDEPTNGLDVMSTRALRVTVQRLREEGKCVVLSTHIMQEVAALCDRVVIMAAGRVVMAGAPAEIMAQTGRNSLEDAFVDAIGSDEGLMA